MSGRPRAGFVRWFAEPRVVTWAFVTGERGVAPEWRIPGGLPFTPTLAWANVQAVWFARTRPRGAAAARGASRQVGSVSARRGLTSDKADRRSFLAASRGLRVLDLVSAALVRFAAPWAGRPAPPARGERPGSLAQEQVCDGLSDGCTGLHWLDGTIFRQCCDEHDLCYEADCSSPCTKASWLVFWRRWYCTGCNLQAVSCFVSTAVGGGGEAGGGISGGGSGGACGEGDPCTRCSYADWCPAECVSCNVI